MSSGSLATTTTLRMLVSRVTSGRTTVSTCPTPSFRRCYHSLVCLPHSSFSLSLSAHSTPLFFSEHDNIYVRSSCALAFAAAVEMHPELIAESIVGLQELYVERAKVLAPESVFQSQLHGVLERIRG